MIKILPRVTEAVSGEAGLEPKSVCHQSMPLASTYGHLLCHKGNCGGERGRGPSPTLLKLPGKKIKAEKNMRQRRDAKAQREKDRKKRAGDTKQTAGMGVSPHTHGPPVGP